MTVTPGRRVCIVSDWIDGPHPLCPTAMATGLLARALAQAGDEVTVLLPGSLPGAIPLTSWFPYFDRLGIRLECLFLPDLIPNYRSWCVFRHLRSRDYHYLLFLDRGAAGYWCIRAQSQGIAFAGTRLALVVADPSEFGFREKWTDPPEPRYLMTLEMERFLLREAETILAMSADLATYVGQSGSRQPAAAIPEFLPSSLLTAIAGALESRSRCAIAGDTPRWPLPVAITLGLLGIADEASGVRQIAELVPRTWHNTGPLVAELLAIGGTGLLATGEDGYLLLALALHRWPGRLELRPCRTLEEFAADVAAQLMIVVDGRRPGCDAVTEWIARAAGHPSVQLKSRSSGLIGDTVALWSAESFADRLDAARRAIPESLARAVGFQQVAGSAIDALRSIIFGADPVIARLPHDAHAVLPKVSICISHFDRPDLLEQALQSLRTQTYPNIEVVVYDDASPRQLTKDYLASLGPEFAARGWQIIRGEFERWPAAGRNEAARHATGDYLLIMDDDNCARPDEIATMVAVAEHTGATAVSCFAYLFEENNYPQQAETSTYFGGRVAAIPIGHGIAIGSMWNIFGDTNYMYRTSVFRAIAGFESLPSVGCEDYHISSRMTLRGARMEVIPLGLYDYRYSPHNMAKGISNERVYYSHLRVTTVIGRSFHAPRAIFDLAAMNFNSHSQKHGESYWRHNGRAHFKDPQQHMPLWRQAEAAVRLAAAFAANGAPDCANAVAQSALTTAEITTGLTPDLERAFGLPYSLKSAAIHDSQQQMARARQNSQRHREIPPDGS